MKNQHFCDIFTNNFFISSRLPVVSDCSPGQTARVSSNLHSSSGSMAVSRVPSPPPQEVNTPVAENWCYTQVKYKICNGMTIVHGSFYYCEDVCVAFAHFLDRSIRIGDRLSGRSTYGRALTRDLEPSSPPRSTTLPEQRKCAVR